jgi:hypothetical protein
LLLLFFLILLFFIFYFLGSSKKNNKKNKFKKHQRNKKRKKKTTEEIFFIFGEMPPKFKPEEFDSWLAKNKKETEKSKQKRTYSVDNKALADFNTIANSLPTTTQEKPPKKTVTFSFPAENKEVNQAGALVSENLLSRPPAYNPEFTEVKSSSPLLPVSYSRGSYPQNSYQQTSYVPNSYQLSNSTQAFSSFPASSHSYPPAFFSKPVSSYPQSQPVLFPNATQMYKDLLQWPGLDPNLKQYLLALSQNSGTILLCQLQSLWLSMMQNKGMVAPANVISTFSNVPPQELPPQELPQQKKTLIEGNDGETKRSSPILKPDELGVNKAKKWLNSLGPSDVDALHQQTYPLTAPTYPTPPDAPYYSGPSLEENYAQITKEFYKFPYYYSHFPAYQNLLKNFELKSAVFLNGVNSHNTPTTNKALSNSIHLLLKDKSKFYYFNGLDVKNNNNLTDFGLTSSNIPSFPSEKLNVNYLLPVKFTYDGTSDYVVFYLSYQTVLLGYNKYKLWLYNPNIKKTENQTHWENVFVNHIKKVWQRENKLELEWDEESLQPYEAIKVVSEKKELQNATMYPVYATYYANQILMGATPEQSYSNLLSPDLLMPSVGFFRKEKNPISSHLKPISPHIKQHQWQYYLLYVTLWGNAFYFIDLEKRISDFTQNENTKRANNKKYICYLDWIQYQDRIRNDFPDVFVGNNADLLKKIFVIPSIFWRISSTCFQKIKNYLEKNNFRNVDQFFELVKAQQLATALETLSITTTDTYVKPTSIDDFFFNHFQFFPHDWTTSTALLGWPQIINDFITWQNNGFPINGPEFKAQNSILNSLWLRELGSTTTYYPTPEYCMMCFAIDVCNSFPKSDAWNPTTTSANWIQLNGLPTLSNSSITMADILMGFGNGFENTLNAWNKEQIAHYIVAREKEILLRVYFWFRQNPGCLVWR